MNQRRARLLSFSFPFAVWLVGNVGGVTHGLQIVGDWLEAQNGAASLHPAVTHTATLAVLAAFASFGQWYLEWFRDAEGWRYPLGTLIVVDLALNALGFYDLAMGRTVWPLVWPVFMLATAVAIVPNILCQSLWTRELKELLRPQPGRVVAKPAKPQATAPKPQAALPAVPKAQPAPARTNGHIRPLPPVERVERPIDQAYLEELQ